MDELDRRIAEEASRLSDSASGEKRGSFARTAIYDLIFPLTLEQAAASNRMAIVGIRVRAKSEKGLPVTRVVVSTMGPPPGNFVLPGIFRFYPVKKTSETTVASRTFGAYEQTLYLFLPLRFLRQKSEVILMLKDDSRMTIAKFPNPDLDRTLPEFLRAGKIENEEEEKLPDPAWVVPAVTARYCIDQPSSPAK